MPLKNLRLGGSVSLSAGKAEVSSVTSELTFKLLDNVENGIDHYQHLSSDWLIPNPARRGRLVKSYLNGSIAFMLTSIPGTKPET